MFADELLDNVADTGNGHSSTHPSIDNGGKTCKDKLPNRIVTWCKAEVLGNEKQEQSRPVLGRGLLPRYQRQPLSG
jgi:hypothetical protein